MQIIKIEKIIQIARDDKAYYYTIKRSLLVLYTSHDYLVFVAIFHGIKTLITKSDYMIINKDCKKIVTHSTVKRIILIILYRYSIYTLLYIS